MRILVTGFEPWKGSINPAGIIAKGLNGKKFDGIIVVGLEVPEDFYGLPALAASLVEEYRPQAVISLGWDYTPAIKVEKTARNMMDSDFGGEEVPDNFGNFPDSAPVVRGGPPSYQSSLPVESIVKAIKSAGIPAFTSYDAGTHCCNTMMYSFLRAVSLKRIDAISGHIHIPPTRAVKTHLKVKKMALGKERRAIEIAVATTARYLKNR
jgi:pyroglutamyl-peptidase